MYKLPKTKEGADRQYAFIYRAYRRVYADMFGCDWTTIAINAPEVCAHLRAIIALRPSLPSRKPQVKLGLEWPSR